MTFSAKIVDRFRSLFNLELKYFVRLRPFMRDVEVPALGLWKLLEVKQKGLMLNQSISIFSDVYFYSALGFFRLKIHSAFTWSIGCWWRWRRGWILIPRSLLLLLFQLFLFLLLFLGRNQISLSVVLLDGPANQKGQIQFPVWWNIKFCGLTDIAVIKFYTGDLCMSTKNMGQNTASSIYSKFKVETSSMNAMGEG